MRQQRIHDVQRIGEYLAIQAGQKGTHLQCRRATIDHDTLARLAQRRGRAADRFFGIQVPGDGLVERRARKCFAFT